MIINDSGGVFDDSHMLIIKLESRNFFLEL